MADLPLFASGLLAGVWLVLVALAKPRLLLYAVFALAPTQFLFIPVSDFFVSPADVLVLGGGFGLLIRLVAGSRRARSALRQHRFLALLIAAYVLGFVVLGTFSRTVVRIPLAIIPSLLACELLLRRQHIELAAGALVVAAVVDGGYGLFWYLMGAPLHPVRFSGLSGVNFSAMVVLTGAAILLARVARTRRPLRLSGPGALGALGFATLSQMGVLAAAGAWIYVLRRVLTRRNTFRLAAAVVVVLIIAASSGFVRDRIAARYSRVVQNDGVALSSTEIRWALLLMAAERFVDSPFVGIGYAQFERSAPGTAQATGAGQGTHNTYLEVLVEGGIVAFACLALHFIQYWRPLGRAIRDIRQRKDAPGAAALVGLPIVLLSAALGNMLLHYFFWAVCGLALAYLNLLRRETRDGVSDAVDVPTVSAPA